MRSVTPHLVCAGAGDAIEFHKRAYGAVELMRLPAPARSPGLDPTRHGCL